MLLCASQPGCGAPKVPGIGFRVSGGLIKGFRASTRAPVAGVEAAGALAVLGPDCLGFQV